MPRVTTQLVAGKKPVDVSVAKDVNPRKAEILMFDSTGKINLFIFDAIELEVNHADPQHEGAKSYQETIDVNAINNAIILHVIAQREGKVIGSANFSEINIIEVIKKYLSTDIVNREDTAIEIYVSYYSLATKRKFIRNVSASRALVADAKYNEELLSLTAIPNFDEFIRGLINSYLCTVANGQNIQTWSVTQCLGLFFSTKSGLPLNQNDIQKLSIVVNIIEQYISSLDKASKDVASLTNLQVLLIQENGQWLTTLKELIQLEIDTIHEYLAINKIDLLADAVKNLLAGRFDSYSNDAEIKDVLLEVKSYLQADTNSLIYRKAVQCCVKNNNPSPSLQLFRLGLRWALRKAVNKKDIQVVSSESRLDKISNNPSFEQICARYQEIGKPFKLDISKSNFIVATLLKLANIDTDEIIRAPITMADDNECVNIYLHLPLFKVKQFIDEINRIIPSSSTKIIHPNVQYLNDPVTFCQISIDRKAFIGPIADLISLILQNAQALDLRFIETYQKQSGTYAAIAEEKIKSLKGDNVLENSSLVSLDQLIKSVGKAITDEKIASKPKPAAASPASFWSAPPPQVVNIPAAAKQPPLRFNEEQAANAIKLIQRAIENILNGNLITFNYEGNTQVISLTRKVKKDVYEYYAGCLQERGLTAEVRDADHHIFTFVIDIKHTLEELAQILKISMDDINKNNLPPLRSNITI